MSNRDRAELLLLAIIWGASFLFMRVAAPEFGAIALVQIRVAVAALFLLGVLFFRGGSRKLLSEAMPLTVVGATSSALPFTLFAYATLSITAGTAAVLNATAPLFAAVVAYVWLRDKLAPARIAGLVVGFGGVLVLVWDKIAINDGGTALALVAGLAASLSYGFAVNYTKTRLHAVDPIVNAAGSQVTSTLLLLPLCIAYWPAVSPSLASWLAVIALGVVCTAIAYIAGSGAESREIVHELSGTCRDGSARNLTAAAVASLRCSGLTGDRSRTVASSCSRADLRARFASCVAGFANTTLTGSRSATTSGAASTRTNACGACRESSTWRGASGWMPHRPVPKRSRKSSRAVRLVRCISDARMVARSRPFPSRTRPRSAGMGRFTCAAISRSTLRRA